MSGRRISFLLLHCFWWGHQRTYPWATCEWCLAPAKDPIYDTIEALPYTEPRVTYSQILPPPDIIDIVGGEVVYPEVTSA